MAKRIVLTPRSQAQRLRILDFWFKHTGDKIYSKNLDDGLKRTFQLLSEYPAIGRIIPEYQTRSFSEQPVRCFIYRDYQIMYQMMDDITLILQVWDTRQNPETK
jgi:plasmid stabilization system protein ParE